MARALLILLWLLVPVRPADAGPFTGGFTCTVSGRIERGPSGEPAFTRSDGCRMIGHRLEGGDLLLYSPDHWVLIHLPELTDAHPLWYHWSAARAMVGGVGCRVEWGRVDQPDQPEAVGLPSSLPEGS